MQASDSLIQTILSRTGHNIQVALLTRGPVDKHYILSVSVIVIGKLSTSIAETFRDQAITLPAHYINLTNKKQLYDRHM